MGQPRGRRSAANRARTPLVMPGIAPNQNAVRISDQHRHLNNPFRILEMF
jgi:hypothetical protein